MSFFSNSVCTKGFFPLVSYNGRIQRGDKNIGFFSNTGLNPLKNHKATKPAFNVIPSSAHL